MKLIKTETLTFEKGRSYPVEVTVGYPIQYFRKPISRDEEIGRPGHLEDGEPHEMSDYDVCIKSFKIVKKWYE